MKGTRSRLEALGTKGTFVALVVTALVSFQLGAMSGKSSSPPLRHTPTTTFNDKAVALASNQPILAAPEPIPQVPVDQPKAPLPLAEESRPSSEVPEECNPYSLPGFVSSKTNQWTIFSHLYNNRTTPILPLGGTLSSHIPTCIPTNTPPSRNDVITALQTGNLTNLSHLKNSLIILAGDSQDRNAVDRLCAISHKSLQPSVKAYYWNGTLYPKGVTEVDWGQTPDLPAHAYPHVCELGKLNLTVVNYFHFGVRWSGFYDRTRFMRKGESSEPGERIRKQLVPFLKARGLVGGKQSRYPKGPTLITAHSLLWDLKGVNFGKFAELEYVQKYLGLWMHQARTAFLTTLAKEFPETEIVWRTVPFADARNVQQKFGMAQMAVLNEAGREVARGVGVEVLEWAWPLVGRWDLLAADGFHQGSKGLDLLWRLVAGKVERMRIAEGSGGKVQGGEDGNAAEGEYDE
ncbi:hypothetical protein HK097_004505 [Rhizophlyctis rosea]|uniref:Uncharacterized protein n=1 Tax=Rhizophlyctis rosea TaxID=64517 RepID=A0AAD5SEU2_9FUNG|nr:hypothetical protein HK097_004505 [Rhizophlyctis rosea]